MPARRSSHHLKQLHSQNSNSIFGMAVKVIAAAVLLSSALIIQVHIRTGKAFLASYHSTQHCQVSLLHLTAPHSKQTALLRFSVGVVQHHRHRQRSQHTQAAQPGQGTVNQCHCPTFPAITTDTRAITLCNTLPLLCCKAVP
jgi:hypothetical protein